MTALSFLTDEDFDNDILHGALRRMPTLDIVRVQDVGLAEQDDPTVLAWAADDGRAILTHDASTMIAFAYERVREGSPMPGVFVVRQSQQLREAIDAILLLAECSTAEEWHGQVCHLPL